MKEEIRNRFEKNVASGEIFDYEKNEISQDIITFIQSETDLAVAEERKRIVEEVEKLYQDESPVDCTDGETPVQTYGYEETHNQALKAVLSIIKKDK